MDKKQKRHNSKKIYQLTVVKYIFYILGASLVTSFTALMAISVNPAVAEDNIVIVSQEQQTPSLEDKIIFEKQQTASLTESGKTQTPKAIVFPKVNSSNLSPAQMLMISPKQGDHQILLQAQTPSVDSQTQLNDSELRQRLKIKPLFGGGKQSYIPSLSFGIPSAFGANWGDFFVQASGATRKERNGNGGLDGSISAGFGLGDSQKSIGLEVAFNEGSIKNFGDNGTFDLKAHRVLSTSTTNQIAAAVGWNTFAQYGNEGVADSSVYGEVTSVSLLQPNSPQNQMPLALTVGVGGGNFRDGNDDVGVFGGVGLQVHPQVGIGASWSGVALNAGLSFVPVQTIPLTIQLEGLDLTDRTAGGSAVLLSVSYGFNFLPK
ncbi:MULTISPECIES: hypothetical protein [unclassified Nostoc]|uniref:hypothetical protein n=1 Tax=unclassified Nostoc TaxID=2593658 RepID=UPI00262B5ECB|nr:hypothetical protein [Nostoc sp. S13]MDF5735515.1 hypothetical protein [Nostoc sp. S13]